MAVKKKKSKVVSKERRPASPQETVGRPSHQELQDSAARVRRLRKFLGLSQKQFAERLGETDRDRQVKQSIVSAWERGEKLPSRERFAQFGNLALAYDDISWFWGKAGIKSGDVIRAEAARLAREMGKLLAVPATKKIPQDGEPLPLAEWMVPTRSTAYVRLADPDGLHYPAFKSGDLLIIDESQTDPWELAEGARLLINVGPPPGQAQHWAEAQKRFERDEPEEAKRRLRERVWPYERIGLTVGWLRKQIETDAAGTKHGIFSLQAPWLSWLPVGMGLPARQPWNEANTSVISSKAILGRVVISIDADVAAKLSRPERKKK